MDPAEHLQVVFQEVQSLHTVYSATPVFGVDHTTEDKPLPLEDVKARRTHDDVQIASHVTRAPFCCVLRAACCVLRAACCGAGCAV